MRTSSDSSKARAVGGPPRSTNWRHSPPSSTGQSSMEKRPSGLRHQGEGTATGFPRAESSSTCRQLPHAKARSRPPSRSISLRMAGL